MRKAISPIISTILLIVVALALIAILLSWGSNFITRSTTEVDDSVERECTGAYISFDSCDYNETDEKLTVVFTNTGSVNFKQDFNFNVILRDADNNMDFSNVNVLDSESLSVGTTKSFVIEEYTGRPPIKLEVRNTMCPIFTWNTNCS